jgi:hypothetical protein
MAGAVSAKYISMGAENCPMPICRATVSPPMAAAPMPIGTAFEGSEFMIGDTIGPYEGKIFRPLGTDILAAALPGTPNTIMRKRGKSNALLDFISTNSGGNQFRCIGPVP